MRSGGITSTSTVVDSNPAATTDTLERTLKSLAENGTNDDVRIIAFFGSRIVNIPFAP